MASEIFFFLAIEHATDGFFSSIIKSSWEHPSSGLLPSQRPL